MTRTLSRARAAVAAFVLIASAAIPAFSADSPRSIVLVLDASGSMWGQIDGEHKIVIARQVLADLARSLPAETEAGLIAYGHRREGDCGDIETVVPLGPADADRLVAELEGLNPKGKTPITGSLEAAFDLVRDREETTTVILVSDGLETCDADPCAAVRAARDAGVAVVTHVVGFGIAEDEVAQLECIAQAGDGQYFAADDAAGLSAALDRAVEAPVEHAASLSVRATAGGAPADAVVRVLRSGELVAGGRTYTGAETNPRVLALPAGSYTVEVEAVRLEGAVPVVFTDVEVLDGETTERAADFSPGELRVGVTRNGELTDAVVRVLLPGSGEQVAGGRTYSSAISNPRAFTLIAGTYDIEIGSVEISGAPEHRWEAVQVSGSETAELAHDFASGVLRVGANAGGEPVDAVVSIIPAAGGRPVAGGRTSAGPGRNPREFVVPPGAYTVKIQPVRLKEAAPQELAVEVARGATVERVADF